MSARHAVALAAIVLAASLVLALQGAALPAAWLPVEEASALELARGGGHLASPASGLLYPVVLAPAARWLSPSTAHGVARALSALFWAAAAVPAYLLARRLVPPGPALGVAVLGLVVPGSVYATAAVADALAILLAVSSLPLLARASERGSGRDLAGALALAASAAFARPWLVVLPFALVVAYALASGRRRTLLSWPGSLAFAAFAGAAYVALAWISPQAAIAVAAPIEVARAGAAALAVAAVGTGVVPWLLAGSGAVRVPHRPETALLMACVPALALAAGVLGAARPTPGVDERPLLVLVPLVLALAAVAWLGRGAGLAVPAAVGVAIAVSALALPALGDAVPAGAAGLSLVSPEGGSRTFLVAGVWAAVTVALLLILVLRRRPVVLLPAALAVLLVVAQTAAWSSVRDEARALLAAETAPRGWVDRHVPADARVVVVAPADRLDARTVAVLTLWNRAVRGAQELDLSPVDPGSGQWGEAPAERFVVARGVELAGTEIARSRAGVLLEPHTPFRLAATVEGVAADGWSGEEAVYRRFWGPRRPGTIAVSASRPAWDGAGGPAEIEVAAGRMEDEPEPRLRVALEPGREHEFEIAVPPPPFRVVVTVAPTFPGEAGRPLGAQLRFAYRPGP